MFGADFPGGRLYQVVRQTDLACYFDGKRTARLSDLQTEERLQSVAVVEHGAVDDAVGVGGKVFQVGVVRGDEPKCAADVEFFEHGFG